MKHLSLVFFSMVFSLSMLGATAPKREFRATWFTTHYAIDWPSTMITSTGNAKQIAAQKAEMDVILDALVAGNMNAFCIQVRPTADAFYKSSYEPWSKNLSGTRGKDPGYDPLAYAVEQGHKRGLEVHLWVNPFRVTASGYVDTNDQVWKNCKEWILKYDNGSFAGQIIDPGFPQARAYVIKVLMEAINNYDVDGILMDDYFYPYGGTTTEDATSKAKYKPTGMNDGDWRRSNVDSTMKALYDSIQIVKPWVRFGMGTFGIWTTQKSVAQKYGISLPAGITGLDDYAVQFCNPVEWVKNGYVDYLAPQLYWATTSTGQCYHTLCKWWAQDVCKHFSDLLPGKKKVDFFVSQAAYRFNTDEICSEIDDNRLYDKTGCPGSIFYNTKSYVKDNGQGTTQLHLAVANQRFTSKSLPPAMDWKTSATLAAPTSLKYQDGVLTWQHDKCKRFTVYLYPRGMKTADAIANPLYLLGMFYDSKASLSFKGEKTVAVCAFDRFGVEHVAATLDVSAQGPEYEPQVSGNLKLQQIWGESVAETQCMSVGNANRSIAYYQGELYISDGANSQLHELSAADGTFIRTTNLPATYHIWHNLRITSDGILLLGNTGTTTNALKTYYGGQLPSTSIVPTKETEYSLNEFGRCDYFYPYGTKNDGFITMLSNYNQTLLRAPLNNGHIGTPTIVTHTDLPTGVSAKALPYSATTCLCQTTMNPPSEHVIATGKCVDSFSGNDTPQELMCTGMTWFELNQRKFVLTPADCFGSFEVFDVTNGLSKAKRIFQPTASLGSTSHTAYTMDFATQIAKDTVIIYVLAPDNGVAAFRLSVNSSTSVEQTTPTHLQNNVSYNILGQRVDASYKGIVVRNGGKYIQY